MSLAALTCKMLFYLISLVPNQTLIITSIHLWAWALCFFRHKTFQIRSFLCKGLFSIFHSVGAEPRAVPARRGVPRDRAPHEGGDGGARGARHTQTASRHRRAACAATTPGYIYFTQTFSIFPLTSQSLMYCFI